MINTHIEAGAFDNGVLHERARILTEAKRLRDEAMAQAEHSKKTEPDHPKWITYAGQSSGLQYIISFIEDLLDGDSDGK